MAATAADADMNRFAAHRAPSCTAIRRHSGV
jgi:hypothetical protein